jgi:signal transduction histidine kinase
MGLQLLSSSSLLKAENQETKEFCETLTCMSLSCETAINTLNDLLLYDKIEDGKIILEKKPISVESFLYNCLKPFEIQVLLLL